MKKEIEIKDLKNFEEFVKSDKYVSIISNSVKRNGISNSVYNLSEASKIQNLFNYEVIDMPSVTNQKQSGRCWMFSSLNVIRNIVKKNLKVKDIDLSFTYLFFFDKLEKSNNKLQKVIDNIDKDILSNEFDYALSFGSEQDGGWWHMFVDLINKYGICPKGCQEETYSSTSSHELDQLLNRIVTRGVSRLKKSYNIDKNLDSLYLIKEETLKDVYKVLTITLGKPVSNFEFDYETQIDDKKEIKHIVSNPKDFFNDYVKSDLSDYVSLINFESSDYPFYTKYMSHGGLAKYNQNYFKLNVPLFELKNAAINSIKANEPMWFGSCVGESSYRKEGILAPEAFDLENTFGLDLSCDKFDLYRFHNTSTSHAMTLCGVHIENNKPTRWKVQNSWGNEVGFDGIFVMSDKWFDEYVYEVVVNKKYLSKEVIDSLSKETIILKYNDSIQ